MHRTGSHNLHSKFQNLWRLGRRKRCRDAGVRDIVKHSFSLRVLRQRHLRLLLLLRHIAGANVSETEVPLPHQIVIELAIGIRNRSTRLNYPM